MIENHTPFKRLSLAVLLAGAATTNLAYAEVLELHAFSQDDRRGTSSEQPLGVLTVQDQSGSQDSWDAYREYSPAAKGYRGLFKLDLPEGVEVDNIQGLELQVNYRGPTRSEQRWRWQMRDFAARRWVNIGDNADAGDWTWTEMALPVPGDAGDYLDANGQFKLRYLTGSSRYASQMDYLGLQVTLSDPQPPEPPPPSGLWQPTPGTSWQWQLSGSIDTSIDVEMYDIDLFDAPQAVIDELKAAGRVVICYFSAGSWEDWRPDAADFPAATQGRSNGWPGERWLDVRQLDALAPVMTQRLDLAVSKGCDGVEPDNVDGYANNTGFPLSSSDQLAFNRWLADRAHARGLSIGLKNDLDQIEELEPWFDWALNEQCFEFNECDLLLPFVRANKAVFGVEYKGNPADYCPRANALDYDWLVKDLDLGAPRQSCRDYP